ncbi:S26 family signal peptidase [Salinirubellus sp. GCM10025818]|uniref:S26 family signal peptidase n=1 Tax=Salinirubellus TaxID=2162630 RepID=UPI00360849D4
MSARRAFVVALELAAVAVVLSLVVGQVLGQPVLLAFVETGSMAPTMEPGDGFVAIPAQLAGPPEEGDVVTFRAEELHGGGLTTHRVVGETESGYVTRGDANPFTDQDGEEPPVKDAQIVAVAWAPGGDVLVVPHLGTAVLAVQGVLGTVQRNLASMLGTRALLGPTGLGYVFAGAMGLLYVLDLLRESGNVKEKDDAERARERSTGRSVDLYLVGFALILVVGATSAMVAPGGTQEYGVVSAEFDSERPTVIPMGESGTVPYPVGNGGFVPVIAYLEPASEGIEVDPGQARLARGERVNATVTLHAPPETGYYRRFLVEHRYLALLPPSVIDSLYRLHPWAPIAAIDALLGGGFYLLGRALVGGGRVRTRRRSRGGRSSLGRRLGGLLPGRR